MRNPQINILDGTSCRDESPRPGPTGTGQETPSIWDHLRSPIGGSSNEDMHEEAWFERRYPNWLAAAREHFRVAIDQWVQAHWGESFFDGPVERINIYSRGPKRNDNRFEQQGDKPQTPFEADKVLGSFSIDIVLPVEIQYSSSTRNIPQSSPDNDRYAWQTEMYVEDVLGLQQHDPIYNRFTGWLFPSRRAVRARWTISGNGYRAGLVPGRFSKR